ncbi:MAG: uracil-DNA glycosylase [Methylocystis sp.]|nr:uracil-DNA glycosylase [Methylocystis sp.]
MPIADPRELSALIDWYVESGVDIALDDVPHDRYAESAVARDAAPAPETKSRNAELALVAQKRAERSDASEPREISPLAPAEAARKAQESAGGACDLDDLATRLAAFNHAPFRDMARHFLFAAGARTARAMAFDIAPGETEEATGDAFCGQAARLLDNILAAIGLNRENTRLAYLSPWRPPGVAALTPPQIAVFAPFARRHVELCRPEFLLLFGEPPARALIETSAPFSKLRGRAFDLRFGDHNVVARVFSPLESILKSAALKPAAWRDLRKIAESLRG